MKKIKTKRHILKFYFLLVFVFVSLTVIGTLTLITTIEIFQEEQIELKHYLLPPISLLLFFLAFYSVYTYWKNSPVIVIDPSGKSIRFGSKTYSLKDIEKLSLTGKMPFKYIIKFPMEGASILFKDGVKQYIYDDMYSNTWQVKTYLDHAVNNTAPLVETDLKSVNKSLLRFEKEEIFKGTPLTSMRGISLWGAVVFFLWLMVFIIKTPPISFLIFFFSFNAFWFVLHSWMMHYFSLSQKYFIVKNHNYFWMTKIFRIEEIKEVVFETQGRQPNCLRIVTMNYKNKLYPAGTLRDQTWLKLKDKLESHGIQVRNECIPDKNNA